MSKIEWTDKTWNPIVGCSKISEGCQNCYAEKMAFRMTNLLGQNITNTWAAYSTVINDKKWSGKTDFINSAIQKPFNWKKPQKIFVCSMGDLFHESVPFEWQFKVFQMIHECPQHIFQILTKRPDIMLKRMENIYFHLRRNYPWIKIPLENVWLGVTTENQTTANERIPLLLEIPANKRFISCEPLLSDIDFPWFQDLQPNNGTLLNQLDWVICGPETGPKARPMEKIWIENIYKQCQSANVPFFDKKDILKKDLKQFPK